MKKITLLKQLFYVILTFAFLIGNAGVMAQPPQTGGEAGQKQIVTGVKGDEYLIYVVDRVEGSRTLVAKVDMAQIHPLFRAMMSISPNGERLLFITAEDTSLKNAEVYVAATDGSGIQKIATFAEDLWTVAPVWSPDSQRLALVRQESPADGHPDIGLWVLNIRDSSLTKVQTDDSFQLDIFLRVPEGVLRWSENGDALQYVDRYTTPPRLHEVNLISGAQRSWEAPEETLMDGISVQALPCSVPVFNQRAYNNVMQTCGMTIHDAGCALTSVTMVAKYYGVNNIDPPTMNSRLGNYACGLHWYRVDDRNVTDGRMNITRARQGFSYSKLQEDLNSGRPPIVWVTKGCSGYNGTHFVVVTSGSGTNPANYRINDPADGSTTKTLGYYTSNGYCLRKINTYSGTPSCSDPDGGDISYGQTKNGSISPAYDKDYFYFSGSAGDAVTIRMNKNGSSLDSYVFLYKPDGSYLGSDDDSGGSRNSRLTKTLPTTGRYKIRARGYSNSTGAYTLQLTKESASDPDDGRWIAFGRTFNGTISPSNDRDVYYFSGRAGTVVSIRMNKSGSSVDSYLELYNNSGSRIAVNDDGGGNRNSWLLKELPSNGTYRIVARSWRYSSTGSYSLSLSRVTSSNLALNRPARASSVEFRGVEPYKAFDGRRNTRWSSRFRDPGWIYVDLGSSKTFNKVILRWETAYAKRYGIYVWTGSYWRSLYWTNNGNGGLDTITFSPATGRYVLMFGIERGTRWGYSLWEFGVYNTANLLMPLVPPDPGDKEVDNIYPLAPLGPNDDDKEVMLIGEDDDAQEDLPLAAGTSEGDPSDSVGESIPYAEIISPSELDSLYTEPGYLRFEGYAVDNDEDGESIVAYSWRSSLDGDIGTQITFTVPITSLSSGLHTIYFKAQDNEGYWSEEVTTTLRLGDQFEVYLPIVLK